MTGWGFLGLVVVVVAILIILGYIII